MSCVFLRERSSRRHFGSSSSLWPTLLLLLRYRRRPCGRLVVEFGRHGSAEPPHQRSFLSSFPGAARLVLGFADPIGRMVLLKPQWEPRDLNLNETCEKETWQELSLWEQGQLIRHALWPKYFTLDPDSKYVVYWDTTPQSTPPRTSSTARSVSWRAAP